MKNSRTILTLSAPILTFILLAGCQNPLTKAAHQVQYSAYEMIGVQKRDLLKTRVDDARDEQKEAGEEFQDALTQLKAIYGFDGGKLEKEYDALKSSYDRSAHQAEVVRKSIKKVEYVAQDLFEEWEKEIKQIETPSFRSKSAQTLAETKQRYQVLHKNLKASEAKMEPVLKKLNDLVLFLKHNLNAQAIGSLKTESLRIQNEIESMIKDMNKTIDSADKFIKEMP